MLDVRAYESSDFSEINRILVSVFGYEKANVSRDMAHEFVAVFDDRVVGYFILNEMRDIVRDIKIFHVDYVCVDKDHQGRGIGRKMMEYAIKYAEDNGAARLELTSSNKRALAHKLYLSLGFEIRDSAIFRKELV